MKEATEATLGNDKYLLWNKRGVFSLAIEIPTPILTWLKHLESIPSTQRS